MSLKHCALDKLKYFKDMQTTGEKNIEVGQVLGETLQGGEKVG
jgi:hypothetical protein